MSEENPPRDLESRPLVPSSPPSSPLPSAQPSLDGDNKPVLVKSDDVMPTEAVERAEEAGGGLNEPESEVLAKIEWNPELDVALLYALQNHKLVGSNKYFHMICVHDAFMKNAGIQCTIACLWDKVSQWYDFELLADNEINPFPLPDQPNEFCLPEYFNLTQPIDTPIVVDSDDGSGTYRLRSTHKPK